MAIHSPRSPSPRPARCESPAFDPAAIETPWYRWCEENGFFHAEIDPTRPPHTIMIPLPNVTGALHLGHALNNSIQDMLTRIARMKGFSALWMPGTDHAGVATQAIVEKRLWQEEGQTRHDLGRAAMLERIWAWKDTYEGRILGQLKRLCASLDWERTEFTMSPRLSRSVRHVFLALFREGLIYRGKRLINWSTGIQTALSNDELVYKTVHTNFWFLRYPILGEEGSFIEVATTRPETMLGDTAVAVHPDPEAALLERLAAAQAAGDTEKIERLQRRLAEDLPRLQRFASLIGKQALLPLMDRPIPILGDALLADPEKGTGAVKVTPAHDPNDYACGLRHQLPMINLLHPDGRLNEFAGRFQGLQSSTEGREQVVAALQKGGYLVKIEDLTHEVAHCYRSDTVIEPFLLSQWFVQMKPLVELARQCYLDGQVAFFPEMRGRDYLRWLDSTPDWCISRQVWWGHRIPIWYCCSCSPAIQIDKDGDPIGFSIPDDALPIIPVSDDAEKTPLSCPTCGSSHLVQDPDVLDTWFSSQLWPLSTLGWPEETPDLAYFYPTTTLVTGRDILALWVARMIMMGMKFMKKTPFANVVIHGTIQDEHGNIMSKSRGNGFDPVRVIEGGSDIIEGKEPLGEIPAKRREYYKAYGADALRYGLLSATSGHAQDIRLQILRSKRLDEDGLPAYDVDIPRFEEGRRLCNKVWQASRGVVFRQTEGYKADTRLEAIEDRWLSDRIHTTLLKIDDALKTFELGTICEEIYHLFWDDFCSWYLEIVKPRLWGNAGDESKAQAQTHLLRALDALLRMMQPIMPMISEAVWQELRSLRLAAGETALPEALLVAPWPSLADFPADPEATALNDALRSISQAVLQIRSKQPGITEQTRLPKLLISGPDPAFLAALQTSFPSLQRFLRIEAIEIQTDAKVIPLSVTALAGPLSLCLPLEGVIDPQAELQRLQTQIEGLKKAIERNQKQLQNKNFVDRAPAAVVQQVRDKLDQDTQALGLLETQQNELSAHA